MKDWESYITLLTVLLISKCVCFLFLFFFIFRFFFIKAVEPSVLRYVADWLEKMAHLHKYWPDSIEDNHRNS
jgi:hypothetical protein